MRLAKDVGRLPAETGDSASKARYHLPADVGDCEYQRLAKDVGRLPAETGDSASKVRYHLPADVGDCEYQRLAKDVGRLPAETGDSASKHTDFMPQKWVGNENPKMATEFAQNPNDRQSKFMNGNQPEKNYLHQVNSWLNNPKGRAQKETFSTYEQPNIGNTYRDSRYQLLVQQHGLATSSCSQETTPRQINGIDIKTLVDIIQEASRPREQAQELPAYRTTGKITVEIPDFFGDIRKYQYFKETFITLTQGASNIEKLSILKSKLKGIAQHQLDTMTIIGNNYGAAWHALDRRFGNVRMIFAKELKYLTELKQVHANSTKELEHLILAVRGFMANIQSMGFEQNPLSEAFIVTFVEGKMDIITRTEYERDLRSSADFPTVKEMLNALDRRLEILQAARFSAKKPTNAEKEDPRKYHRRERREKAFQFMQITEPAPQKYEDSIRCYICLKDHYVEKCPTLIAAPMKQKMLMHYKVCLRCLRHKYVKGKVCKNLKYVKCDNCHKDHHTLLHYEKSIAIQPAVSQNQVVLQTINKQEEVSEPNEGSENKFQASKVVLPTGYAHVLSEHAGPTLVRCMLDSGSQSTAITKKLAKELKLPRTPTQVDVYGAGGERITTIKEYAEVTLKIKDGSIIRTRALVMKKVSPKLPSEAFKMPKEMLKEKLADPEFNRPAEIDLILGSNVAPSLYTKGTKIVEGMLLLNTKMGWTVQGPISKTMRTGKVKIHSSAIIREPLCKITSSIHNREKHNYQPGIIPTININETIGIFSAPPEIEIKNKIDINKKKLKIRSEINDKISELPSETSDYRSYGYIASVAIIIILSIAKYWRKNQQGTSTTGSGQVQSNNTEWSQSPV
jgi:hypothetical protein